MAAEAAGERTYLSLFRSWCDLEYFGGLFLPQFGSCVAVFLACHCHVETKETQHVSHVVTFNGPNWQQPRSWRVLNNCSHRTTVEVRMMLLATTVDEEMSREIALRDLSKRGWGRRYWL